MGMFFGSPAKDPNTNAKWEGEHKCTHPLSSKQIMSVRWYSVPIGTELVNGLVGVGRGALRFFTFGQVEIAGGQHYSHDCLEIYYVCNQCEELHEDRQTFINSMWNIFNYWRPPKPLCPCGTRMELKQATVDKKIKCNCCNRYIPSTQWMYVYGGAHGDNRIYVCPNGDDHWSYCHGCSTRIKGAGYVTIEYGKHCDGRAWHYGGYNKVTTMNAKWIPNTKITLQTARNLFDAYLTHWNGYNYNIFDPNHNCKAYANNLYYQDWYQYKSQKSKVEY